MANAIDLRDLVQTAPFDEESEFMPISDIVGLDIEIIKTKTFTNDKGDGVYLLCRFPDSDSETLFHICTHSVGIVKTISNELVQRRLSEGYVLNAHIIQRKSTSSDRMVYAFA